jgi:hypothetical protein
MVWQAVVVTTGGSALAGAAPGSPVAFGRVLVLDARRAASAAVLLQDSTDPLVIVAHRCDDTAARVLATFVAANQPGRLVAHAVTDHAPLAALAAMDPRGRSRPRRRPRPERVARPARGRLVRCGAPLGGPPRDSQPPHGPARPVVAAGSRFLVRQGPGGTSLPAVRAAELLADVPRRAQDMLVTDADDATVRAVTAAVGPTALRTVDTLGTWRHVYGSDEISQITLLPSRPEDHVRPPGPGCEGCGQHAAEPVCAFCRTRTRLADPAPQLVETP